MCGTQPDSVKAEPIRVPRARAFVVMLTKAIITQIALIAISLTVYAFNPPYSRTSQTDINAPIRLADPKDALILSLRAQLMASQDREKAAEDREKAAKIRSKGIGLLGTRDLKHAYLKFPEASYADFIQQFELSEFHNMLPADQKLPAVQNNGKRCQPTRKRRRNGECSSTFEAAHLAPLGVECVRNWLTLCVPFFDTPSCHIQPARLAAEYFMFGVELNGRRKLNTGFLHSFRNFIFWADQNTYLDSYPMIMFIPLKDSAGDYFISTGTQRYLVICMNTDSCTFSLVPVITESKNDMDCADPQAIRAVEVFNEYLVNIAGYLRSEEVFLEGNSSRYTAKANLSAEFRLFLRGQHGMVVPKLPEQGKIAVLEIGPDSVHGDPHPFFLALRSMNAWLYFNHRERTMPEWTAFLKNRCAQNATQLVNSLSTPLVLLTACRDHIADIKTCLLCKSREILSNPDRFEGVDLNILELARVYADDIESLSEADIDLLDKVHMRDSEDEDSHEPADFSWSEDLPDCAGAPQTPPSSSAHMMRLASAGGAEDAAVNTLLHRGHDKLELR
jgi:hypothetical protein